MVFRVIYPYRVSGRLFPGSVGRQAVNKAQTEEFRRMLLNLRRKLCQNVTHLEKEALRNEGQVMDELSDLPVDHLADRGTDNFAKDLLIGVLQNSEAEICDIDAALARIEAGTFGICDGCGERIPNARLKALPFARLCIECKQAEEQLGRGG